MYPSVSFLPWIEIEEELTIGQLRLLPYDRGLRSRGDLPAVSKRDQDGILGAYADRKNCLVQRATLMEIGGWRSGQPISPATFSELFRAREILAFAAISNRTLFGGGDYVNSTHYKLIVQAFERGHDGFAFNVRRRDGSSSNYWNREGFAFQRPLHAPQGARVDVDVKLVDALLHLPADDPLLLAIREFNSVNSDSADVSPHVELVMCNSALEWLSGISGSKGLLDAVNAWFPADRAWVGQGPMKVHWLKRWKPANDRLLAGWVKDFSALRGMSAHANQRGHSLWPHFSHLAFVSLLFPAVVKIVLEEREFYQRTQRDLDDAAAIENYLLYDPAMPTPVGDRSPWVEVRSVIRSRRLETSLRERLGELNAPPALRDGG